MPRIDWGALAKRLFKWGKKKAAEEAEEELRRRLGSKTTNDSDIRSSSMTRPEP